MNAPDAARPAERPLAQVEAELSSTKDALAFAVESVEKMREQLARGVGICSVGTCRQPALVLLNGWPICGEHGEEREQASLAQARAEGCRRGALAVLMAVEEAAAPQGSSRTWQKAFDDVVDAARARAAAQQATTDGEREEEPNA